MHVQQRDPFYDVPETNQPATASQFECSNLDHRSADLMVFKIFLAFCIILELAFWSNNERTRG